MVEPSYYYRIEKDFLKAVPNPYLLHFNLTSSYKLNNYYNDGNEVIVNDAKNSNKSKRDFLSEILSRMKELDHEPRLVLDLQLEDDNKQYGPPNLHKWAKDSMSSWGNSVIDKSLYLTMPNPIQNTIRHKDINEKVFKYFKMCKTFLYEVVGNRTCFEKCN